MRWLIMTISLKDYSVKSSNEGHWRIKVGHLKNITVKQSTQIISKKSIEKFKKYNSKKVVCYTWLREKEFYIRNFECLYELYSHSLHDTKF